jgi:glycerophosphoryl diester phosphodiesterase
MRIGQSTLEQISKLRIGGHPIPTLESLFSLVKGRVPLLLEVKIDKDLRRWVPALSERLSEYRGPFGVMSFDPRIGRLLKVRLPKVRRGLVVRSNLPTARRIMAMWLADPQFIAVERTALGNAWVRRARSHMPVYSWTIRTEAERAQAAVHADALIWESDGRPRN